MLGWEKCADILARWGDRSEGGEISEISRPGQRFLMRSSRRFIKKKFVMPSPPRCLRRDNFIWCVSDRPYFQYRKRIEIFVFSSTGNSQSLLARLMCSTSTPRPRGRGCQPRPPPSTCHSSTIPPEGSTGSYPSREQRLLSTPPSHHTWRSQKRPKSSASGQTSELTLSTAWALAQK